MSVGEDLPTFQRCTPDEPRVADQRRRRVTFQFVRHVNRVEHDQDGDDEPPFCFRTKATDPEARCLHQAVRNISNIIAIINDEQLVREIQRHCRAAAEAHQV